MGSFFSSTTATVAAPQQPKTETVHIPIYHRPTTLSSVIDKDLDKMLTDATASFKQGCDSPV